MLPTIHIPTLVAFLSSFILSARKVTVPEVSRSTFHPVITEFEYYTRKTGFDQLTLKNDFQEANITSRVVVFIHDINFEDPDLSNIEFQKLKSALLNEKHNVSAFIRVNWGAVSDARNYHTIVKLHGNQIATTVAAELEWLIATLEIDTESIGIFGQGIGGIIAGRAGRYIKQGGHEIGLIIGIGSPTAASELNSEFELRHDDAKSVISTQHGNFVSACVSGSSTNFWNDVSCQKKAEMDLFISDLQSSDDIWYKKDYTNNLAQMRNATAPVNILLLDVSPGMQAENRLQRLIKISRRFVKSVPLNTFLGIIVFGGSARIVQEPVIIQNEAVRKNMLQKLPTMRTQIPGTSIKAALQTALSITNSVSGNEACLEIILITDGEEKQSSLTIAFSNQLSSACAKINAIIVGGSVNGQTKLKSLSDLSNGGIAVLENDNSYEVEDLLQNLIVRTSRKVIPHLRQILLISKQVSISDSANFIIDNEIGRNTQIKISTPRFLNIKASVTDPSGRTIVSNPEQADHDLDSIIFNFPNAATGKWSVELMPNIISVTGIPHEIATVSLITMPNNHKESVVRLDAKLSNTILNYSSTDPLSIHAKLNRGNEYRIISAVVIAEIRSPGTTPITVRLLDNGAGADEVKNDGIYAGYITANLTEGLNYEINVMSTSHNLTKMRRITEDDSFMVIPMEKACFKLKNEFEREARLGRIQVIGHYQRSVPARIRDLQVRRVIEQEKETTSPIWCEIAWTATGQELDKGTASSFEVMARTNLKENQGNSFVFKNVHVKSGSLIPVAAGQSQFVVVEIPNEFIASVPVPHDKLIISNALYVTVRSFNDEAESSQVSNIGIVDITPPTGIPSFFGLRVFVALVFVTICGVLFYFFRHIRRKFVYRRIGNNKS